MRRFYSKRSLTAVPTTVGSLSKYDTGISVRYQLPSPLNSDTMNSSMTSSMSSIDAVTAAAWPPLATVAIVCRSQPPIAALHHLARSVSAFLDPSAFWSIADACKFGSVRLLERITARSDVFASSCDGDASEQEKERQFERGVEEAAALGHLPIVRWLVRRFPTGFVTDSAVNSAAKNGHLAVLEWLFGNHDHVYWGGDEMYYAVANNHLDVAKFLNEHTASSADEMYLRDEKCLLDEAALHGDLVMLKWLYEERGDYLSYEGVMRAVDRGFLDAVQYMCTTVESVVQASDLRMDKAAANGHLEMIRWLHDQNAWCTRQAMNRAAANGHLEIVKFLHANRSEGCSTDAMDSAAENGHLETVEWLHEHRSEGCTQFAMDSAAKNGFLDVVKWLHTHRTEGCTTRAMDDASAGGRLEMVQWLHANRTEGCTDIALTGVKAHRCEKVVEWLYEEQIFPRS
ncbi:hypothetical protein BBJ28_00025605 [Nothophytophthora sp. Chile5]|nr:hypothetical protein BBJ28_00025605 [Nothophytophthora sp. Chile5]